MITKNKILESLAHRLNMQPTDFEIEIFKMLEPNCQMIEAKINGYRVNVQSEVENILEEEIINCYLNSKQFIRKLKLDKLNKIT